MLKIFQKVSLLFLLSVSTLYADTPYYLDFKYVLNQSDAGKKAQDTLKKKLEGGLKKISVTEKSLQEEEKKNNTAKKVSKTRRI